MDLARRSAAEPTAVGRIAAALRAEILSGDLEPGAPLREEHLASRFGAARHTVRAALAKLVAERLAVAEAYRGVRVTSFGRDEIVALQQLRAALETEAVRIARARYGDRWPADVLAPAERALAALEGMSPPPLAMDAPLDERADWLEVERVHAEFHRALVEASASPRIIEAHAALGSELQLFLLRVRPHYTVAELVVEHRDLLDAVQRRGPEAVLEHLEHSTRLLVGE